MSEKEDDFFDKTENQDFSATTMTTRFKKLIGKSDEPEKTRESSIVKQPEEIMWNSEKALPRSKAKFWNSIIGTESKPKENKSNPLNPSESFWINTNTDIQLTDYWKVKFTARVDILKKELVSQNFSIYRDLHCWELSLNWTPSGFGWGVYLRINVKSPTFRDIKIEQKSGLYGRRSF